MRIEDGRTVAAGPPITVTFEGAPLTAYAGESIAAALMAAGVRGFRESEGGGRRGLLCGMGTCHECLVEVDGRPHLRACVTPVAAGMRVVIQTPRPALADRPAPVVPARPEVASPKVLVIGGGPAGLSAALAAERLGAKVTLLEERAALGGQYYKQLAPAHRFARARATDRQYRDGAALIAAVAAGGVEVRTRCAVWGAFPPREVAANTPHGTALFRPRAVVIATGAYEHCPPMPGWTLPGFMTTGAAQTLLRAYRVAPGRRVLVAGNGPLNFQLAAELVRARVPVAALVELAPRPGLGELPALFSALARAPDLIRDGLGYRRALARAGVPVLYGHGVVAAEGEAGVSAATVARLDRAGRPVAGTAQRFAVDAVCAGYGFAAANEIARALGCRHETRADGVLATARAGDGATSVEGVFVAGDAAGLGGARAALEEGAIAGIAAARVAGYGPGAADAKALARHRRRLAAQRRFQAALWRLFAAPPITAQLAAPETAVCRCEQVSLAAIREALADGVVTLGELKRHTRVGMGRCQGRYCTPALLALLAETTGRAADPFGHFAPRDPVRPQPLAALARPAPSLHNTIAPPPD